MTRTWLRAAVAGWKGIEGEYGTTVGDQKPGTRLGG